LLVIYNNLSELYLHGYDATDGSADACNIADMDDDVATDDDNITVVHTHIIIRLDLTASQQLSNIFCQTLCWILVLT